MLSRMTKQLTRLGPEIRNPEVEDQYLQAEFVRAREYAKPLILALAGLFLAFGAADFFILQAPSTIQIVLYIRALFFVMVLWLYRRIDTLTDYDTLVAWLTRYKVLVSAAFLLICIVYESPNLIIQSFGAFTLVLAFYLVPNRWLNQMAVSLTLISVFMITAIERMTYITPSELAAVGLYLTLTVAINSISSHQIHHHRRLQFINGRKLARMSMTDELTRLYNRKKFNEEIKFWVNRATRENIPLSLILLDIDYLKAVNDSMGHLAGDAVLRQVGTVARRTIRKDDILARWGGDEFAVLLPYTRRHEALRMAKRLRQAVRDEWEEPMHAVTCSTGVASLRKEDTVDRFLHRADKCMYAEKNMRN